jgi:hypothetical protein
MSFQEVILTEGRDRKQKIAILLLLLRLPSQSSPGFSLFRFKSGAERIAVPVETSATTRSKAENDDLLATLNWILFIEQTLSRKQEAQV